MNVHENHAPPSGRMRNNSLQGQQQDSLVASAVVLATNYIFLPFLFFVYQYLFSSFSFLMLM